MPGPLLGVTIEGSLKRGYIAGPLVVLGHGSWNSPLSLPWPLASGILFKPYHSGANRYFGWGLLPDGLRYDKVQPEKDSFPGGSGEWGMGHRNLILAGIVVSATNPYFYTMVGFHGNGIHPSGLYYGSIGYLGLLLWPYPIGFHMVCGDFHRILQGKEADE